MGSNVKVAAIQMDVKFAQPEFNADEIEKWLRETAQHNCQLVVFPECAISGYCFESREEALATALPIDGTLIERFQACCRETEQTVVFGLLEKDGDALYNSLACVGADGLLASYRKVHLPKLGVDQFVDRGDRPFSVVDLGKLRVGLQICYDGSFPEPTRVMALQGADVILLPTNWPTGAGYTADYVPNCRALENHVYFVSANRVGDERGFHFVGKSKICEPNGGNLAFADHDREEILIADIDPAIARQKRLVRVPDKHEIDRFRDRQPDRYQPIVESRTE